MKFKSRGFANSIGLTGALWAAVALAPVMAADTANGSDAAGTAEAGIVSETPAAQGPALPACLPPSAGAMRHRREDREWFANELNLSAEQRDSMRALFVAARPRTRDLGEQLNANRSKLLQTMPDDPNYAQVVTEVAQANASLASARTRERSELRAKMYAVLTPAQRTQWAALEMRRPRHRGAGHC